MTRKESRELAFVILFEQAFTGETAEEIVECAKESRDIEPDLFTEALVFGAEANSQEIEDVIKENIKGWSLSRLSKVTQAILRISVFEIKYMPEVPVSVSINEAVELAKTYGGKDDAPYVNGVLSAVAKNPENICEKTRK